MSFRKPLFFAALGAIGCLLGALVGEAVLTQVMPERTSRSTSVDVLFVLDITGSMSNEIDGVKNGIARFVSSLGTDDVRVGLIAFGDECSGEKSNVLSFGTDTFTHDTTAFSQTVGELELVSGGDDPESSLDALVLGARQAFAPEAVKVMVLITDAPPHVSGEGGLCNSTLVPSQEDAIRALQAMPLDQLHLVVDKESEPAFSLLHAVIPGRVFDLDADGRQNFTDVLPQIGKGIAMAIGSGAVDAKQSRRLLLATGIWTALLAMGAFQFLIIGQNVYLRRAPLQIGLSAIVALLGVAAAGGAAGGLSQWLSSLTSTHASLGLSSRLFVWAVLGAVLSRGIAAFIPNLAPRRAYVGGILGGILGALGFIWASDLALGIGFYGKTADLFGRLIGAALLGFLIGLMISIVEMAFREAWLEVSYGPKEIRTVNLGADPVSFGGDAALCTLYAKGAAPQAFAYRLEQGQVICEDLAAGRRQTVLPGDCQTIGNLVVAVRGNTPSTTPTVAPRNTLPHAPDSASAALALRLSSSRIYPLAVGRRLTSKEIHGLEAHLPDGVVAEVNQNPKDPLILGLKNLSQRAWLAYLPEGGLRTIDPGQSVKLSEGGRIDFGAVEGEIIPHGKA